MAASIEDVARLAGVSVATVSRALRGLPNVAPSTRERVKRAASELHYVVDPHASRLAARRTATIGLVVPMLGQWYYAQLFSGAEGPLVAEGYDILPFVVGGDEVRDRFLATLPFRKRVDGLIIVDLTLTEVEWQRLEAGSVPVVTLGIQRPSGIRLGIDNVGAARLATEHLLAHGHRRIGVISSVEDIPPQFQAPVERERGYREALASGGVEHDPSLVVPGNFSLRGGAEGMSRLLALPDPPTAVFALSDEMAIGALQVARDAGIDVPAEVSVIGFDDHDVAEYVGLTTVRQEVVEQGEAVAREMLALLDDPGTAGGDRELRLATRLIVRATTGPSPTTRRRGAPARPSGSHVWHP